MDREQVEHSAVARVCDKHKAFIRSERAKIKPAKAKRHIHKNSSTSYNPYDPSFVGSRGRRSGGRGLTHDDNR